MSKNDPLRPNPYSTGGHTQPLATVTAGKKYRVRNADEQAKKWADNLSWDQAHKLKERLAGQRKSTNLVIEDMSVAYPPIKVHVVAEQPPPRIQHPGATNTAPPPAAQPNGAAEQIDETPILTEDGDMNLDDLGDLA